jgi:hypothetical protein
MPKNFIINTLSRILNIVTYRPITRQRLDENTPAGANAQQ